MWYPSYSVMRQLKVFTLVILLFCSSAQAEKNSSVGTVESSPTELNFKIGGLASELFRAQEALAPFGISVSLDLTRDVLQITAIEPWAPKIGQASVALNLSTDFPVELEGKTQHALTLISPGAQINHQWTSPSLTLIPSNHFNPTLHSYSIATGGRLEVQALTHTAGTLTNQGKILSPGQLELTVLDATFENLGKIESSGPLQFKGGQRGQKPKFNNLGEITAPEIRVGSFYQRFYSFQNSQSKSSLINAKKWVGTIHHLTNSGEILITEEVSLSGFKLDNEHGNFHSGGTLSADFAQINNSHGSISGHKRTELKVCEALTNDEGEIGSVSPTHLTLFGAVHTAILGKIQGTDLAIRSDHREPITLPAGELLGEKSVAIFSESKILLPGIQIHTPQLHLAAPDFALDEQRDCSTTVVHCNPIRDFNLTSPYCTQGNVVFIQSCLKPESSDAASSSATPALVLSPANYLKQRFTDLKDEVSQMSVHFEKGRGKFSKFKISLRADLKSAKDVEFVAPLANLYLGDQDSRAALEAQSLRSYANFVFLMDGHVSARDAAIHAPGGLRIGSLTEDATSCVRVADQRLPLMCRNGAVWATQNKTLLHGPLHCDGTMQIGGDFILASEKEQWCNSPDIRVEGNLVLKGSGNMNIVRNLGEILYQGNTPLPKSEYAEPGTLRVAKKLIAEKPVTLRLYSTSLHADQFAGELAAKPIDSTGKTEIEFPGNQPEKLFRASVSSTQGGVVKLEGKNNSGIIAAPQLFLIEKKGQFVLATKNPYYLDQRDPLHDLMKKSFHFNATYVTQDLQAAMQKAADYRFHYSIRERFFFNHTESERFYDQIKNDVVILKPGYGLLPLPPGQAVFSLSPQFLLKQVQDAVQENLMRGYLYEGRPISFELLAELHHNATEYLATLGITWNPDRTLPGADLQLMAPLRAAKNNASLPKKPLIFYKQMINDQGIEELKPFFYLPPSLFEQARAEQTGNVFATILGRFIEGTTAEEMIEELSSESGVRKALIEFFEKNPETKAAVTRAALRYRLKNIELDSTEEDSIVLDFAIRAKDFAIVAENNISIEANQKASSGAIVSKKGNISLVSKKARQNRDGNNTDEEISEQRTLRLEGHLELRAGKDIRTQAVDLSAGSLQFDAQGDFTDAALNLESHSESVAPGVQETEDRTRSETSQFKVGGKMVVRAQNIALQGTRADADAIQLEAKNRLAILGVQEGFQVIKRTEEKTGALFWAGKKVETRSESKLQFIPASLRAKSTIKMQAQETTLQGPKIGASETEIHAERLRILQGRNKSASALMKKSENAWWISMDSEEQKHETFTQAEFNGKTKLYATELELEQVRDEALKYLDQLEFDPEQTKVVYELLNEIHHREATSISAPGPALIAAVAVISSVATGGVG